MLKRAMEKKFIKTQSPCFAKGRYGGRRGGSFRSQREGRTTKVPQGCECSQSWYLYGAEKKEPKKCNLYFNLENKSITKQHKKPVEDIKEQLKVVPCDELFLLRHSKGTELYYELSEKKFEGCYDIEQQLIKEKLVRQEPFDSLLASDEKSSFDDVLPNITQIVSTHIDFNHFHKKVMNKYDQLNGAADYENKNSTQGQKLSWQQISIHVREQLNNLKQLCQILTEKQQEAVSEVYFKNDAGLTNQEIANYLGISLDSLKDRLTGAIKKIKKHHKLTKFALPERRKTSDDAKNWKSTDSEMNGFFRKSNKKVYPLKILDKETLEVKATIMPDKMKANNYYRKLKTTADEQQIKQWAGDLTYLGNY